MINNYVQHNNLDESNTYIDFKNENDTFEFLKDKYNNLNIWSWILDIDQYKAAYTIYLSKYIDMNNNDYILNTLFYSNQSKLRQIHLLLNWPIYNKYFTVNESILSNIYDLFHFCEDEVELCDDSLISFSLVKFDIKNNISIIKKINRSLIRTLNNTDLNKFISIQNEKRELLTNKRKRFFNKIRSSLQLPLLWNENINPIYVSDNHGNIY